MRPHLSISSSSPACSHPLFRAAATVPHHLRSVNSRICAAQRAYEPTAQERDPNAKDVSSTTVNPVFRVSMDTTRTTDEHSNTKLRILFVSESGVCRAPLAVAAFAAAAEQHASFDAASIACTASACRDYNITEGADPFAVHAAEALGWSIPRSYSVQCFVPSSDLVQYDVIFVMDKFTAADVLREASIFDTIYLEQGYTGKVRRLGEFHPSFNNSGKTDDGNIEDALYGNYGEYEDVEKVATEIGECCEGLVEWLVGLENSSSGGESLRAAVAGWLQNAEGVEWLAPPLLSRR